LSNYLTKTYFIIKLDYVLAIMFNITTLNLNFITDFSIIIIINAIINFIMDFINEKNWDFMLEENCILNVIIL